MTQLFEDKTGKILTKEEVEELSEHEKEEREIKAVEDKRIPGWHEYC